MRIDKFTNGKYKQNCYLLYNKKHEAILVDPGGAADEIRDHIEKKKLKLLAIINTHAHHDHVGGISDLKDWYSCPFFLSSEDLQLLNHVNLYLKAFKDNWLCRVPKVDYFLDQIELPIELGDIKVDILFTPGHTPGGICIKINEVMFTGDTLFRGNIGLNPFPGYDENALKNSLKYLCQLDLDLILYPGHGEVTTLREEMLNNVMLKDLIAS